MPEETLNGGFDIYHVYWFLAGLGLGLLFAAFIWLRGKFYRPVEKELKRKLSDTESELRDLEKTMKIDLKQRVPANTEMDLEKKAFEERHRELAAKVASMEADLQQAALERSRLEKEVAKGDQVNALNESLINLMKSEVRDFAQLWAKLETRFNEQAPYGELVSELRDFDEHNQTRRLPVKERVVEATSTKPVAEENA